MNAVPLYFNELFARKLGHQAVPAHPLLVMNVVFGMTVEDLSEQALAHLGYWNLRFPRFVYPGDTLISSSRCSTNGERVETRPRHRPRAHHGPQPARRGSLRVRAPDPGEEALRAWRRLDAHPQPERGRADARARADPGERARLRRSRGGAHRQRAGQPGRRDPPADRQEDGRAGLFRAHLLAPITAAAAWTCSPWPSSPRSCPRPGCRSAR